ncbi:hypothetical protein B0J12DRAFT_746175 [Macrophomina phaseolina]|uniref:Uncharacterized protein n=1 Tax=Macrophomina phaseolina TaxID=35725 RepID=A0ABQ8FTM1_9PEZI|nr:hypothetical protein B0J12DRAFT_746175 [Macrophomina phaseolina]
MSATRPQFRKPIVVTGITDTLSRSVANSFLALPQEWCVRGVEGPVAAFTDAYECFAMSDFWTPLRDSAGHTAAATAGMPVTDYLADLEVRREKNMAHAGAGEGVVGGLQRFVC